MNVIILTFFQQDCKHCIDLSLHLLLVLSPSCYASKFVANSSICVTCSFIFVCNSNFSFIFLKIVTHEFRLRVLRVRNFFYKFINVTRLDKPRLPQTSNFKGWRFITPSWNMPSVLIVHLLLYEHMKNFRSIAWHDIKLKLRIGCMWKPGFVKSGHKCC